MMKSLTLTTENFHDVQAELERRLSSFNVEQKDILWAQLLVEEIFLRMTDYGHAAQINVQVVKQFFGKIKVRMSAEGFSYNPLVEVTDLSEDDDDFTAVMILKSNRARLNWVRKNNFNVVTIDVGGETNAQMRLLIAAMVGGLICGFAMNAALSPESIALVKENFITPIQTMFLDALNMVIAPMIFFSIISGIISMGAGAGVGKIGTKMVGIYFCLSSISVVIGLIFGQIIFSGEVPQIGTIPAASDAEVDAYEFSLVKFIVDIIPPNLISPVVDGNMLQIIFVAVLFGSCLNALGDKVHLLKELVANCNEFFMKVVDLIIVFVPLIAFFAMILLVVDTGVDTVLMMGKVLAGLLIGSVALLGMHMLIIAFVGKLSPTPFMKKIPSLMPTPFATGSGAVSMPITMDFCIKKLGISPKITSFSIPIGTTVNANGDCLYMPLAVTMFLKMYGVDVDLDAMLIIFAMTLSLSSGAPAIPNVIVICILTITATFGVPSEIAGLLFCMDAVSDRICTCINEAGNVTATLTLARTENLVDEKIYLS